jgi:glycine dehydrogenase subunit 2
METIVGEATESPETLKQAPSRTPVRRIDEVLAARRPIVRWHPEEQS